MEEESQNGGNATPTKELAVAVATAHEVEEEEPMVGPGPAPRGKRKSPLQSDHSLPSAERPLFTRLLNSSFSLGFFTRFTKFRFQQDNKDTKSSSLTSPPSSSLSPTSPPSSSLSRIWKHHVFPSFHGADVRKTFLSHVMEAFRRKGIDLFIDNDIERTKSIDSELEKAIRVSKIAIIMLSRNYASSSWCLEELAQIMKCREELGQIVMTIFYQVDPTHVRNQTGSFGKAFRKTCKGKTKEHIGRWRKALEDVAKIAGEHSHRWVDEAAMIEKIATDVSNMINSTPSTDLDDYVGMGAHMKRMEQLLRLDSDEVRMIGIWGPLGIGKSTIARVLYNQFSSSFQLCAIIEGIKGFYRKLCLNEYSAQLQLQNHMLSQIVNHKGNMISHLGVAQIWLKDKKVLLVLDDVDQFEQLDALAKETTWFGPGSRVIITTEDLGVLKTHGIKQTYHVDFPSNDDAFQIFCMHAFGQKHPDDGFSELAWEVIALAGNLPLGLKVLGSALRKKSKQEWERELPRLRTRLDGKMESIIKFSYDGLYDEEKYLFLYIACLYSFEKRIKVEELLANHIAGVRQSLDVLAEKSLITIYSFGKIEMHTLLVQFGIKTSREQSVIHGHVKRHLLVAERDICEVLSDDTTDCRRFIGINLDLREIEEDMNISEKAIESMSTLQFVSIHGHGVAHSERLHSLLFHSQKIRSLHWQYFQNICLPSNFKPEFLIDLVMHNSKLQKLWDGTKPLRNLKWMDLESSTDLKELPDLSTATNLKELNLHNCSSLVELPSPIGKLTNLQSLDLGGWSSLVELPSSIGKLTSLQSLVLMGCSSLIELPSSIGNATNLQKLDLSGCSSLVNLPSSIGNATNLQKLDLNGCSSLVNLPSSIGNATNLQKLDLSECSNLVELPSIGNATKLEELILDNCSSLVKLPSSINATNLQILSLENCSCVVELPAIENANNLWKLELNNCSSLMKLPSSIESATNLLMLNLSGCSSLVNLPSSIENATNLKELDLSNCSNLVELPSIGNATKLVKLILDNCSSLVKFPSSINATNLKDLSLKNCSRIVKLPAIENATNLWILNLRNCSSLLELPPIGTATNLWRWDISGCSSLKEFPHAPWVKGMSCLHGLILDNCNNLVSLPQFSDSLRYINAHNCKSLERLDCSFNNPYIHLRFSNCFKLNQEARDLIIHTSTRGYAILPGTQVPGCFNYRATAGGPLTIKLNEKHLSTSLKFKACIMLVKEKEETGDHKDWTEVSVNIMDKQNDLTVVCKHLIYPFLTGHIYTFEVEAGEVSSTELVFEFETDSSKWKIGECGVYQILEVP